MALLAQPLGQLVLMLLVMCSGAHGALLPVWPNINGNISTGNATARFSHDFVVRWTGPGPLDTAWYQNRVRSAASSSSSAGSLITSVTVSAPMSSPTTLFPRMAESYSMACSNTSCTVDSASFVGGLRGLETLAQLAQGSGAPLQVPFSVSNDAPRFPYRGFLIDCARRFLPPATIKRVLDFMSTAKLNVLHIHLTDSTAFPFESELYPSLSAKGAYHPKAVYSKADLADLVAYATRRGIRVMPEIDMPGHSSFGKGLPELTIAACGGALNPTLEGTYTMLKGLLGEMAALFPDPYLALGGDEVSFADCATADKGVKAWLAARNMTAASLLPWFWRRMTDDVLPDVNRQLAEQGLPGKVAHLWGEGDLSNLDPHTMAPGSVFNLYTPLNSTLSTTARLGVPAILSAPYYLDQDQAYADGKRFPGPAAYCGNDPGPGDKHINEIWKCFYAASPTDGMTDARLMRNTSLVLGGEICIWGEGTSSFTIEEQAFTSAAASAERLWSGTAYTEQDPSARLADYVCMLNKMGLRASPVGPGFCLADLY